MFGRGVPTSNYTERVPYMTPKSIPYNTPVWGLKAEIIPYNVPVQDIIRNYDPKANTE